MVHLKWRHKVCLEMWWPFLYSFIKPATSSFHREPDSLHTTFLRITSYALLYQCRYCCDAQPWGREDIPPNNVTTSLRRLCNGIVDSNFQKCCQKWSERVQVLYTYVCQMKGVCWECVFFLALKISAFKRWEPASSKAWWRLPFLWTIYGNLVEVQRENLDVWLVLLINDLERICK